MFDLARSIIPEELLANPGILYQFYIYPIATAITISVLMLTVCTGRRPLKQLAGRVLIHAADLLNNRNRRLEEKRIMENYFSLRKKMFEPGTLIGSGFYVAGGLLILMILTKLVFFGIVPTQSMVPTIMAGDLVLAEGLSKNISAGDVIIFNPPRSNEMYVHRVYSISGDYIITKGDNSDIDPWKLSKTNVLGKAVTIGGQPIKIRGVGIYFLNVKDPRVAGDPTIKSVRKTIATIQTFGPLIAVALILFALLTVSKRR